ncbi:MAG: RNA methyltransferase [Ignavibacteriae bacterium]|nr:RNA methyltransferase [Ignavibacteriota bacterium]MCB9216055.1 RNA methyltransferase [Ignavibacteria bacterium]
MKKVNRRLSFDRSVEIDPATKRTRRRIEKFRRVIERRQYDLHIILENVHDPHNVSAVLRTCDAVGVGTVHLIYNSEEFPKIGKKSSTGVGKWTDLKYYLTVEECYQTLREAGVKIFATDLNEGAVSLYKIEGTSPIALVFGNERDGVSEEASALADGNFHVPMSGLAESLNISVACAVSLYEIKRQRLKAGMYDEPSLSESEVEVILAEWAER